MPLDPNAASVHPIVTIPSALAIARRATPPRPALRPSHLLPSVCRPAPRRTISFPSRRAWSRDRRHRGFHPAAALHRDRTGHHQRFSLPRDGPSWFHPAAALPRARTSHHHRFSLHRAGPIRAFHQAGPRIVTTRVTERRQDEQPCRWTQTPLRSTLLLRFRLHWQ